MNIFLLIGYCESGFPGFLQSLQNNICLDIILNKITNVFFHIIFNSLFIIHFLIRHAEVPTVP
jgi:hypothetical protein